MKRFHLHISVNNLDESIRFYSTLFAAKPTVLQSDYAKWMLEDPRINFAISTHRQPVGVNHLGFQVDSGEELRGLHTQLQAADSQLIQENEQPCCYAKSDKYWVTDPTGIAWETFHTLGRGHRRPQHERLLRSSGECTLNCFPAASLLRDWDRRCWRRPWWGPGSWRNAWPVVTWQSRCSRTRSPLWQCSIR